VLQGLLDMGTFEVISSTEGLPLVAFHLKEQPDRSYDEFHVAERLRMYGWVVPAYTLAKGNQVLLLLIRPTHLGNDDNAAEFRRHTYNSLA